MYTSSVGTAPTRTVAGLVSHVLLQAGDVDGSALSATWVEIAPGGAQAPHAHEPEQVYVVVRGVGRMLVGGEERDLAAGDLALAPGGVVHGIVNVGDEPLVYVSAATPAFRVSDHYDAQD